MSTTERKLPAAGGAFKRPLWRSLQEAGGRLGPEFTFVSGTAAAQTGPTVEEASTGEAELVEAAFAIRAVDGPSRSAFTHFLDGVERSCVVGYVGLVPILYGHVAAVVRERRDTAFMTFAAQERPGLFFPFEHVPRERVAQLGLPEEALVDTQAPGSERHPVRLADLGRAAVKRERERLEVAVANVWAQRCRSGWLVVDGPAGIAPDVLATGRAVGVIKSHRTHFLSEKAMSEVLLMPARHRSTVFRPVRPKVGEVYSWYLRLRPRENRDLHFGLVRIEASASAETVRRADEISRWLLNETGPLALPDPRWDTLLYPIRDCEQYLRSRMPTLWPDEL